MDRDEYPMAANPGVVSSAVKLSEGPDVQLVPPATVKLKPLQDDAPPPTDEVVDETQPVVEAVEDAQPSAETAEDVQQVAESTEDTQPVAESVEDTQPAADAASDAQPVDADEAVSDESAEDAIEPGQIIEALLFSSDTPLNAARLADLSGVGSAKQVREQIEALNAKYESAGLSFRVECIARGYQLLTLSAYQPWLAKLNKHRDQTRLTPAALETLSVVAYRQPVIRADIEAIRGVACGEVLNRLREMGLVRIIGRAEIVGRPMLYGTTRKFLDTFGLADLDDLPPMESLKLRRAEKRVEAEPESAADADAEMDAEADVTPDSEPVAESEPDETPEVDDATEPEEVPVAVAGA